MSIKSKIIFLGQDLKKHRHIYIMSIPVVLWYIVFCYVPIYGAQIAFKDFSPGLGISGSPFVGLENFFHFFKGIYFVRTFKNTLLISLYTIIFGFPAPIILALILNEVRFKRFKSVVQTTIYLPHFISLVVVCGIIRDFTESNGIINDLVAFLGGERQTMLLNDGLFRSIYIISGIWQNVGWGTIIYLAALSGIDPTQYEAAVVDGAGRFRRMIHVTMPGLAPTIIILFILRIGQLMNVGFEKIILLYNPNIYSTADVISTYTYRKGLLDMDYSYSSAVGLFNSIINFSLVFTSNFISRRINGTSLW